MSTKKELNDMRNHAKYNQPAKGKIQCPFCKTPAFYYKLASHTTQRHDINERELKEYLGLDHKKGLITPELKERLRQHALNNKSKVIDQNLLKHGQRSRFTPKHKVNYKRSPQTLARLKIHIKSIIKR